MHDAICAYRLGSIYVPSLAPIYTFFHNFHKPRFTKAIFHMFYAYNGMRNV